MPDITIIERRDRAFVIAVTSVGERWLENNIYEGIIKTIEIPQEQVEDFVKELEAADLSVEVK